MGHKSGNTASKLACAVLGARGYSGVELVRWLLDHPRAQVTAVAASEPNWALSDLLHHPYAAKAQVVPMPKKGEPLTGPLAEIDTVFLATPAAVSMEMAELFLKNGTHVIDLSGAFRLPQATFEAAYREKHEAPALLARAAYGLMPWASAAVAENPKPALIANPGCYVTAVLLALLPLFKGGLLDPSMLVVDAKSGTTGAGKKPSENLLLSEAADECAPYKVGAHQHAPEITRYLERYGASAKIDSFFFTTHLLPVRRGILASIYAKVLPNVTEAQVFDAYAKAYAHTPLVKFGPFTAPASSLKRVVGTPLTSISAKLVGDQLHVFSVLDNLLKGAATQAIENFNVIHGEKPEFGLWPETLRPMERTERQC